MNTTPARTTGVVIVTHNSGEFLDTCLEAVSRHCQNIVVVDNASTDSTCRIARKHAGVRLIANPINRGFAAAVNQGVELLGDNFILLLNPDAMLESGIDDLVDACSRSGVGAASGLLINAEGAPQTGFFVRRFPTPWTLAFETLGINRLWPSNPVNRRYRMPDFDSASPQDVEQPAGAFLLIRRSVWSELGGFDERFHPLWFEDVDFLQRLRHRAHRITYVPTAVALHYGGHSIERLSPGKRAWYWYANLLSYAAKHYGPLGLRLDCAAVCCGVLARSVAGIAARGRAAGSGRVLQLAIKGFLGGRPSIESAIRSARADDEGNPKTELRNTHTHDLS